uniref:Box C/D snoRNA protein 1 n=1 Tax=Noccaea caerulescens TaxID=107243 RepID=A0A1J3F1W9_NOCCA
MDNPACEECKLNPWKYICPGCSIRSCGLDCVKSHKQRTGCTGKRKLEFVPISQFDDNLLLSDYNMLEDTKRVAESSQRWRNKLCKYSSFQLPESLRRLQNAANSRNTRLSFLPGGMLKREKNQSRYRKKCISWTVEWRFHSTDVVLLNHGVGEDTNLCSVLENHLKPGPWIHKLKPFCDVDLDSLRLFICKDPEGGAKAPFKELNIKAPLRQQLAGVDILEYPVIHVYLPSQSCDFQVIRDVDPTPDPTIYDGHGSTQGLTFEMEEDPEVVDDEFTKNSHAQEIEFEQLPIDAYAELFPDMDPGDYFDFDYECVKGFGSVDNCHLQNLATDCNDDGLEEGEIIE